MKTDADLVINPEFEEQQAAQKKRHWFTLSPMAKILSIVAIILLAVLIVLIVLRFRPSLVGAPDMYVVELEEFTNALDAASDPVIIDIRNESDFNEAHIVGAEHGPYDSCFIYGVDTCTRKACDERRPHFFYSVKGEEYHEIRQAIASTARRACWTEVWMLDGGFEAWKEAELPIE